MSSPSDVVLSQPPRSHALRRRALIAALTVLALLSGLLRAAPALAEEEPVPVDRSLAVAAWRTGGGQVRLAAEAALVGSDAQAREFLDSGWQQAQRTDERDAVAGVISEGGPSVRAAAQRALDAADAGDQNAIATFLSDGWRGPSDIDARLSVNQLMAAGGPQVREAAQRVLDSENPAQLREFLDSGWQVQWQTDQRLRVNQAMATGGPQVQAAAQKALDTGTPEALEAFLEYGWAVATARDEETETLTGLLAQAQAAGELAAQETQQAKQEAERARAASEAARRSAEEAARATAEARENTAQAAAHAKRAAVAAQKAAQAAKVAVEAAAAASRAARAAASAAARAASAASRAGQAAANAYKAAAAAATDASKAGDARRAAEAANAIAREARSFADKAEQAGQALDAGRQATEAAKAAAEQAKLAAAANDEAVRHARDAGADATDAIAAAAQARANADRAVRAAQSAEKYLAVAIAATFAARDAARRAATNAETAARAAIEAAEHAGEATEAARRAAEHATAATAAAQDAVEAATQALTVFQAARDADAERLAIVRDQGLEVAQAANVEYEAQQRAVDWDAEQAAQRDAETSRLIAEAQDPATPRAAAVTASRRAALALADAPGAWTREAAMAALQGSDDAALSFVRTNLALATAQDDRAAVMNLAVTDNTALRDAAMAALAGDDAAVRNFLRTQNYPGRYTQDRLKVNQILAAANGIGDVVLAQKAQEALDAETLQALRDFLDTGQYTAAAIGERVRVNQILASPDSGPELKVAAQVALDGPAPGLREFLSTGQYTAAERDYDSAVHLAVVGGLLEQINQIAETAVQNALEAQAVAAQANGDAAKATDYANQAARSAQQAATYAGRAQDYANQAAQSAEKAATAVNTAKAAATRANASARSAIRSAAWAVSSHQNAVHSANEAAAAAERARQSAINAGKDSDAATAAAKQAYEGYLHARGLEISSCLSEYVSGPSSELEHLLDSPEGEFYRNCVSNVIADPAELANRAYTNAALCGIYPEQSQLYQNCLHSTLDPEFRGIQPLIFFAEAVKGLTAMLAPIGIVAGGLCLATAACGAVAGALLTLGEVGANLHKLINGDQSLAQTLLKLGQTVIEALLFAAVGKMVSAGFRALKDLDVAIRNAQKAQAELQSANLARFRLEMVSWLQSCLRPSNSFLPGTPVLLADGSSKPIEDVRVGDEVRATDTVTGVTQARPVTQTITGAGPKQLVEISLAGADGNGGAGRITATANHPFWVPDLRRWVDAGDLRAGQWLRTSSGTWAQVGAVSPRTESATVYNLTVAEDHTYYVVAGSTPVLVHNANCIEITDLGNGWYETPAGLYYGPSDETYSHGHRILHVLAHARPDPDNPDHTVFYLPSNQSILALVDEAFLARDGSMLVRTEGLRSTWYIPMNRQIGTAGESHLCLIIQDFNEVISAYPSANPNCRKG